MNKKRPVNLDLTSLNFPPMAIASILHRISGITLALLLPVMLCLLSASLRSPESFAQMQAQLATLPYKMLLWAFCTALVYHLLAGIRHMLMDLGYGEHLPAGKYSAIAVIILTALLAILLGIWLC